MAKDKDKGEVLQPGETSADGKITNDGNEPVYLDRRETIRVDTSKGGNADV